MFNGVITEEVLGLILLGAILGFLGALLVLLASYFIPVRIDLKDETWTRKLVFLFGGTVAGAVAAAIEVYDVDDAELNILIQVGVGAAWLHTTEVLMAGGRVVANGWMTRNLDPDQLERVKEEVKKLRVETKKEGQKGVDP